MNPSIAYVLLLLSVVFGVAGQLLLKHGMTRRPEFGLAELPTLIFDPLILGGFTSYAVSTLIYLTALETLDLSLAYPTVSLGYVLIILFSRLFFQETVSLSRWIAVLIICTGVAIVGFGS